MNMKVKLNCMNCFYLIEFDTCRDIYMSTAEFTLNDAVSHMS